MVTGSPISPLTANLFMEEFKVKAISSASTLPAYGSGIWMIPFSCNSQNTVTSSSNTSTPLTHIYPIYYQGPQGRWFHTLPGHPSFPGTQ